MKQKGIILLLASLLVIGSMGIGIAVINSAFLIEEADSTETHNITVLKYYDINGDGKYQEEIDEPIEEWDFELWRKDGTQWGYLATATTNEDGLAFFENYEAGRHYKVREYLPEGWYNTGSAHYLGEEYDMEEELLGNSLMVIDDEEEYDHYVEHSFWLRDPAMVEFGNTEYSDIIVTKLNELEEPLEGWYITLMDSNMNYLDSGETDDDGQIIFEGLEMGEYYVEETLKEGWENITCLQQYVELGPGEEHHVYFINEEIPGDITVYKFDWATENLMDGVYFQLWEANEDEEPVEKIGEPVTTTEGTYTWEDLDPGHYIVQEILPEVEEDEYCWINMTDMLQYVYVERGGEYTVEFWNVRGGRVEGMKFLDVEGDGEFDVGLDMPVSGWQINLWTNVDGEPGTVIDTTYTDSSGEYSFCVAPGEYFVQEEMKEGWYPITDEVVGVTVESETTVYVDFANCQYKNIYGIKFYDYSMTGEFDPETDWVLEGWEIRLYDEDGDLLDTTYTDHNGYYFFEVGIGTYTVAEELPDGWRNTTATSKTIELNCCSPKQLINFGNYELPEITIYKFYDVNMDGIYDPDAGDYLLDEMGVDFNVFGDLDSGVEVDFDIEVFGTHNALYEVGYYRLTEIVPEGWIATTDTMQDRTLGPGDHWEAYFGNIDYGDIEVYKFYDWNMNGTWDCGEEMLAGWEFKLWNTTDGDLGNVIRTGTTDENGYILFENLEPGYYAVQEVLREDDCWYPTTDLIQFVDLEPAETEEVWFGNVIGGNIMGYKFCDWNMNGEWDYEEPPIEGWTIYLYKEGETEPFMTTETDENGYYEFTCLEPGYYVVEEELKEGWYNTTSTYYEVELGPEDELWFNFGNYRHHDITGIKFYDFTMSGEFESKMGDIPLRGREIQLWAVEDGEKYGDKPLSTTYTDEHGYYIFEDLEPGHYIVEQVKPCCDWIHTTDRVVHVEIRCEGVVVDFGEYKMSSIDVYVECNTEGVGVTIYISNEYGDQLDYVESGYTGDHGWYISENLEPGYYLVVLEDGQYEHVQLRMGEQVTFETPEENETPQIAAIEAKNTHFN